MNTPSLLLPQSAFRFARLPARKPPRPWRASWVGSCRRERGMLAAVVLATHGIGLLALGAIGATAVAPPTFLPIHIVALAATTATAPQSEPRPPAAGPAPAVAAAPAPVAPPAATLRPAADSTPKRAEQPPPPPKQAPRRDAQRPSTPPTQPQPEPAPAAQPGVRPTPPAAPATVSPPPATAGAAGATEPAATISAARYEAAYLNNPPPVYPVLSRRLLEKGEVMLRVLVSPAGEAVRIELAASSGSSRLDRAATQAVARWRFVPAREGDRHVEAWVRVPIEFKLEGS